MRSIVRAQHIITTQTITVSNKEAFLRLSKGALIPPCLFYPRQDGQVFGFTLIRIMAELGAIKGQEHCNFEQ